MHNLCRRIGILHWFSQCIGALLSAGQGRRLPAWRNTQHANCVAKLLPGPVRQQRLLHTARSSGAPRLIASDCKVSSKPRIVRKAYNRPAASGAGIKHIWSRFAKCADKEGWPTARFLVVLAGAMPHRGAPATRQDPGSFDFEAVPMVSRAQVMVLVAGENLLVFDPPGGGKSYVAGAIGLGLVESGWRVLFARTTDLVQRLQVARCELVLKSAIAFGAALRLSSCLSRYSLRSSGTTVDPGHASPVAAAIVG